MRAPHTLARVSLAVSLVLALFGATQIAVMAQAVAQAYASDSNLQKGAIVALKKGNASMVEPLTTNAITQMQGVVVAANDVPVTLSSTNPIRQQYFVATTGQYEVLVSDQNGPIKSGDYITISSLDGVGMKADSSEPVVLGKATSSFAGGGNTLTTTLVGTTKVAIGRVAVTIAISHNPLAMANSSVPGILQKAGQSIASKPVNSIRLYLGVIVLIATIIVAASMLYSGVRSSLIAVGRNPLAKKSIFRNLVQVTLISLIVFTIGLIAVYLILKL